MKITLTTKQKDELKVELDSRFNAGLGFTQRSFYDKAIENWGWYFGDYPEKPDNGSCPYTDRSVMATVNGARQDLLTVFTSGNAVKFQPLNSDDAYSAKAATDLVNQIFLQDNDGHKIIDSSVLESLVTGVSVVKRYWEETTTRETSESLGIPFNSIDEAENYAAHVIQGLIDGGLNVIDSEIKDNDDGTFDFAVYYEKPVKRCKVENLPLYECVFDEQARSIADSKYFCQQTRKSRAEILALGFPEKLADQLDGGYLVDIDPNGLAWAMSNQGQMQYFDNGSSITDGSARNEVREHYISTSILSKDGSEHIYQVLEAGNEIFSVEEVSEIPFTIIAPLPLPNSIIGESLVDYVKDVQQLKTWVKRSILDSASKTANPRYMAIEGAFDRRAIMDNRPGVVVPVDRPDAIGIMPTNPMPQGLDFLMNLADQEIEMRTGVSRTTQGIAAELQGEQGFNTVSMLMAAAQGRIRMMARNLANTSFVDLYKGIYGAVRANGKTPIPVLTSQGVIQIAPQQLPDRTHISVSVALSPAEQQQELMKIKDAMLTVSQFAPEFVQPQQKHYLVQQYFEALGFKNTNDYVTALDQIPQPQPDPKTVAEVQNINADTQLKQATANKMVGDAQLELERHTFDQQKAADEAKFRDAQLVFEQEKAAHETNHKNALLQIEQGKQIHQAKHADDTTAIHAQGNQLKQLQIETDALIKGKQVQSQAQHKESAE